MISTVRLRDIGSTYGGLTGKTKADFGRGDASFVTFLEVMNSTRLRGRALEQVRVAKGEQQSRVMRGDLLFNGSSETPEEVALSAVVEFDPEFTTFLNSFCFGFRLRPDVAVDPTYLAFSSAPQREERSLRLSPKERLATTLPKRSSSTSNSCCRRWSDSARSWHRSATPMS